MLGAEMYGNAVPEMTAAEMYGNIVSETPIAEMNAEDNCNSEDERVLREFEAIEERERQLAKDKGKGVVTETEDLNLECDECYTDGLNGLSSNSDDHYGNCNWSDYLRSEYPQDNGECGLEETGPSEVPVPQDGECKRMPDDPDSLLQRGSDVGDEVLSYVTTARNPRIPRPETEDLMNYEQSLPTEDAEPVFDDTFDLTNTNDLIYPVPNQGDEDVPPVLVETQFNPPTNPPGPGRRRKRRIPSAGEQVVMLYT
ncbi:predicted protein [Arabidopsis lyrata subsp. lyrata]|uniref:Predicted protein n=1 Tax=Arabidopsis lyrata subsp. lyrata TaxID=81972 RepID=D7KLY0_ARALL|nr:predicted protein [Arabidopsis lyrata subsp. lyrata]